MISLKRTAITAIVAGLLVTSLALGNAPEGQGTGAESKVKADFPVDFDSERAFADPKDAVRSRHYLHRAILSNVIKDTSNLQTGQFYINHLLGFSAVWQRRDRYAKFSSASQALSFGYVTPGGHGAEIGLELASVSAIFAGYRYFLRPADYFVWPFAGVGYGYEVNLFQFSENPAELSYYTGSKHMGFGCFGVLVPIVDVSIKAEVRFNFYGVGRIVFTQGIGVIVFL